MATEEVCWEQRFSNYRKAFAQLSRFIEKGELSALETLGLVKAFEYTYELAWTTLKDFLEYRGQSEIFGSRDAIRKAFELGLIGDGEGWMDMVKSRNLTSHIYNEELAGEIARAIISRYFGLFERLKERMEGLLTDGE